MSIVACVRGGVRADGGCLGPAFQLDLDRSTQCTSSVDALGLWSDDMVCRRESRKDAPNNKLAEATKHQNALAEGGKSVEDFAALHDIQYASGRDVDDA